MLRDRWLALGAIGATLACLSCLTPFAVIALGAVGLSAWAAQLGVVVLPVFAGFIALVIYRYRVACRRAR